MEIDSVEYILREIMIGFKGGLVLGQGFSRTLGPVGSKLVFFTPGRGWVREIDPIMLYRTGTGQNDFWYNNANFILMATFINVESFNVIQSVLRTKNSCL